MIKHDNFQNRLDTVGTVAMCKDLLALLELTEKASMISFLYKDSEDMM